MVSLSLWSAAPTFLLALLSFRNTSVSAKPLTDVTTDAHFQKLHSRADYCTTETVASGDSCASLVERCGITSDELLEYNSDDLCSNLVPGQRVCCSKGSLTPQKYDNGTCYTYSVQDEDNCYDIGLPYSLSIADIEELNNGTTWYVWSESSIPPSTFLEQIVLRDPTNNSLRFPNLITRSRSLIRQTGAGQVVPV